MSLTLMIAEDDPAMRQVLKNAVRDISGVEVVGEADDGIDALRLFEDLRARVVVVDIDLPRKNGLELAQDIFEIDPWTYLVFCTGYAQFRDKAFELYAFDYLVKPFKIERVVQTIKRILELESGRSTTGGAEVASMPRVALQGTRLFKDMEKFLLLDLKDIIFITKENRKTTIHYVGGKICTEETIGELEESLKGMMFFRSHKGFLVNLNMVRELIPCGKSTYQVIMHNTQERPLMTWDKLRELEFLTRNGKTAN